MAAPADPAPSPAAPAPEPADSRTAEAAAAPLPAEDSALADGARNGELSLLSPDRPEAFNDARSASPVHWADVDESVRTLDDDSVPTVPPSRRPPTPPPAEPEPPRQQWKGRAEFLLSCCGYAVGVSNVWRFPTLAFENGGGSFLIPYFVALAIMGVPLYLLETALGQLMKKGVYHALSAIHPRFRGVGLAGVVASAVIGLYYPVLLTWALVFMWHSFESPLPWREDSEAFWLDEVLHRSDGLLDWGGIPGKLLAGLALSWVFTFVALRGGVLSSGKVVWVTATVPYAFLIALFFRSVTLEGAGEGVRYYLEPDWDVLADPNVWATAAGQLVYSLGVASAALVTLGSYNPADEDVLADAVIISVLNSFTSIFAGFGVFALLGHMAHEQGVAVEDVVDSGQGLAFVVYPAVLADMPGSNFWAFCFFAMVFTLGVDSQIALVEVIMTTLKDLGLAPRPQLALAGVCTLSFLGGLPFITEAGIFWFDLVDEYIAQIALFLVGALECYAVAVVYGGERFRDEILAATGRRIPDWMLFLWRWVTPGFLLILTALQLTALFIDPLEIDTPDGRSPAGAYVVGWACILLPTACILYSFVFPSSRTGQAGQVATSSV